MNMILKTHWLNLSIAFEKNALLPMVFLFVGVLVFAGLTIEVSDGETLMFDDSVLMMLRSASHPALPIGPNWLTHAAIDVTSLGSITVITLIMLTTTAYLFVQRHSLLAVYVALSIIGGWALSTMLKMMVARPRPDVVPHLVEVNDLSYPSGHAMLSTVAYLTIAVVMARSSSAGPGTTLFAVSIACLLAALIGLSRIYLGVHYPTDVLAGWCAGSLWTLACVSVGRAYIFRPHLPIVQL